MVGGQAGLSSRDSGREGHRSLDCRLAGMRTRCLPPLIRSEVAPRGTPVDGGRTRTRPMSRTRDNFLLQGSVDGEGFSPLKTRIRDDGHQRSALEQGLDRWAPLKVSQIQPAGIGRRDRHARPDSFAPLGEPPHCRPERGPFSREAPGLAPSSRTAPPGRRVGARPVLDLRRPRSSMWTLA